MKLVTSKQRNVLFVFCASPVTIDKRADWGGGEKNLQRGPDGAFLKMNSPFEVSHLVQPNDAKTAPVGWVQTETLGLFDKAPIYVDVSRVLQNGEKISISGLDGVIEYTAKEPSMVCYNVGNDGQPNLKDGWLQTIVNLNKNYEM